MRLKKMTRVGVALVVLANVLAACSGGGKDEGAASRGNDQVEVSMLFAESVFGNIHFELIKEFEKNHPNIKIKAETLPDSSLFDTLRTRISTAELPDIYQLNIGHDTTAMAMKQGYIYDLSQLEASRNFSDSIRKATSLGDKQAIFTLGLGVLGLTYNKAMLADVGYNEPPQTWDQLLDAGKKLKEKGKDLLVYSSKWETGVGNVFHWTFGTHAVKNDAFKQAYLSNSIDWSLPENRAILAEGFQRFKELNDFVRTGSFTNEYATAQQSFANEDAAMLLGGTWEARTLHELAPNLDFGFINLPYTPDAENAYVFVPGDGFAINAKGQHVEEAKVFLNWLFSKEIYGKISEAEGSLSAQSGVGKPDKAYSNAQKWLETDRVISFANTGPIPGATWVALGNAAQEYTFKGELDKVIDKFISEYNKTKAK
ncbi:ABC transporter substrate-binding protein [Paenibacillus chitinolyticus]|uniref:ABC transporter substrate-binding protein n=1 Tax=Paenibacillus chitinolyticus TaxID=79263 RepID=UPI0026E49850|nr:extracellular solute-binding protein [Paenibacillus chitinolyticus]GKS13192.1 ABC transporter substrate-binding protein [Paenibacillus chitinolyticus]